MGEELILGFDVGGTKCAAVLGRAADPGTPLRREWFPTAEAPEPLACLERLAGLGAAMLAAAGAARPTGVGVACGGPLDSRRGVVVAPPNLPRWRDVPVADFLGARFGAPVRLRNDADAGAVAEWRFGAGRGCEHLVFLTCGTGMGAGLIVNGRLYSGASDAAGECGHWRLAPQGPVGFGKAGSFEGFCSGGGIAQLAGAHARARLQRGEAVAWCPDVAAIPALTAKDVAAAAAAGDAAAQAVFAESGAWLGRALAALVDVLNPERVVIGGIFPRAEALLRPAMEAALATEALPASAAACAVVPAALGERIGDVAALCLAAGGF